MLFRSEPSRDDAVGALIAILSEGTVTERDVLVAAALPALGGEPGRDADDPEQLSDPQRQSRPTLRLRVQWPDSFWSSCPAAACRNRGTCASRRPCRTPT